MSLKTDNAWAAGMVDGDGCISIKVSARKYFQLSVVVGQSGLSIPKALTKLKKLYGGNFCKAGQWTSLDRSSRRQPKRNWQVVSIDAHQMLLKILPYLVQKKKEALIGIKFKNFVGKPGQRITSKNRKNQARLFEQMRRHKNYTKRESFYERLVRN